MDRVNHKVHLSYKDILLVPYDDLPCTIESRNLPSIRSEICTRIPVDIPIVSSPMDSVTGVKMALAMDYLGGVGIYTRHINAPDEQDRQLEAVRTIRSYGVENIAVAIGVKNKTYDYVLRLVDAGARIICLDIANGNHIFMLNALEEMGKVKNKIPAIRVIAGNVATPKAAIRLADAGADAVKIGIGPGGACTTRRVTGFGVPQLTAILECAPVLRERNVRVIADGGIRSSGDAIKALWAGADTVMLGYVLAGHTECPMQGIYRGMSSRTVSCRSDVAAEGVCFNVPQRGDVSKTIKEYAAAIKAACSMANAMNLSELRRNVRAIRVSTMSQEESDPVGGE